MINNMIRKIRRRLAENNMKLKLTKRSAQIISSDNYPIVIYPFNPSKDRAIERCSIDRSVILRGPSPAVKPTQLKLKY